MIIAKALCGLGYNKAENLKQINMITKKFKFKNGDEVVEKITGFKGTITGTCFYLTGCNQYLVTAKCERQDKEPIALWYDEGRLDYISTNITEDDVRSIDNGFDLLPNIGKRGV